MGTCAGSLSTVAAVERLCAGARDLRVFRADVLQVLGRVVDFDFHVWVLTDPATGVGMDPLAVAPDLDRVPEIIRLKYLTALNRWSSLDRPAALGDAREQSRLWRDYQRRHEILDVISVVFRDQFGCWGFLDLWTRQPQATEGLDLLAELTPLLTAALRRGQARLFDEVGATPPLGSGPAVLMFDDDLRLLGMTPGADDWARLLLPRADGAHPIPAGALNVAAQLLAREEGIDHAEPLARVHLHQGRWVTLRAARVLPDQQIAVTLEPCTSGERLDLFARTHGLTVRERELLLVLASGLDTAGAAARLHLSAHTVQDHLKSVFDKTGSRSRLLLLARALGR